MMKSLLHVDIIARKLCSEEQLDGAKYVDINPILRVSFSDHTVTSNVISDFRHILINTHGLLDFYI